MNTWLSDPSTLPNGNHGAFPPSNDPSMNFLPSSNTIDPSQFQNQRFLNGTPRNQSPANFHQPSYQVNPVIPAKRPRDREDSLGTSPRQPPGGLPGSRSQTPGQNQYSNFHPGANGAPNFPQAPTPYQHAQGTPNVNVTPSPSAQTPHFNQSGGQQRVGTASPSPFSPHGGPQMSPSHDPSRVPTPHDNPNAFIQPSPYGQNMSQPQFGGPQGMPGGQMPMNPQQFNVMAGHPMAGQRMTPQQAYQMQMLAQARTLQAQQASQNRPSSSGIAHPGTAPGGMGNPQMPGLQQPQGGANKTPEAFTKQLQAFMAQKSLPVDVNPIILGRPVIPLHLYSLVLRSGSSGAVTKTNGWSGIAAQLKFPQMQQIAAGQQLQQYWMQNLAPYEMAWLTSRQKQEQMRMTAQGQMPNQMTPTKPMNLPGQDPNNQFHQGQPGMQNGLKSMPNNSHPPQMDNFQNGTPVKAEPRQTPTPNQNRQSIPRPGETPQTNGQMPMPNYAMPPAKRVDSGAGKDLAAMQALASLPPKIPIEDPFKPVVMPESTFHGPINVQEMYQMADLILTVKPTAPEYREMGLVDIHALTMSIKSGIHAEVRLALDALTVISCESHIQLSLENCDDLVEALIECAQDQVDLLVEHSTEVCADIDLLSYEDVVRGCRAEAESMLDVHEFASSDYDLDRAVDRLICITTLLRNFSFYEANFNVLGMPEVIKLMTSVIRYLGTHNQLLRSHRNTLDFMKDVVVYLSNLSHSIQLPGKEEALCFLHFLLTFAPSPPPVSADSDKVFFTSYSPQIHKYLPSAVDSLAKLLARDEPNRTYYKSIFASESNSSPPYALLSRAFGLAIAPVPESHKGNLIPMVEARKPFILQGMLAAEILSSLAPGPESNLARSWLESGDGFAVSLLRLICMLSTDKVLAQAAQRVAQAGRPNHENDPTVYAAITHRGLSVLRRLAEKSKAGETGDTRFPSNVLPKKESLLGALVTREIDPFVVRQLCIYSGMEE